MSVWKSKNLIPCFPCAMATLKKLKIYAEWSEARKFLELRSWNTMLKLYNFTSPTGRVTLKFH